MRVGLRAACEGEVGGRYFAIRDCVFIDDGIFRAGYGGLPAEIFGYVSEIDASALVVRKCIHRRGAESAEKF